MERRTLRDEGTTGSRCLLDSGLMRRKAPLLVPAEGGGEGRSDGKDRDGNSC